MDEFPKIETKNLIIGRLKSKDIPNIIAYAGNKKIADMTLNIPHPYKEKDAVFWIKNSSEGFKNKTQFTFRIGLKDKDKFIGGIGLKVESRFNRAELGYWIAEPFWNNGFATEATKAVLKFGFEKLTLNKIHASHLIDNPASGKVMLKNGMIKEAELVEHVKKADKYLSLIQYRLTKTEYEKNSA